MRYTLLYPQDLARVRTPCFGPNSVCFENDPARSGVLDRLLFLLHLPLPAARRDRITVGGGPQSIPVETGLRSESRVVSRAYSSDIVYLYDTATRHIFMLNYEERGRPDLFQRDAPVIAASFQILPPGAPVPK